jgi:hypothetical protein
LPIIQYHSSSTLAHVGNEGIVSARVINVDELKAEYQKEMMGVLLLQQ